VTGISYELIKGGKYGKLLADEYYQTAITGHRVSYDRNAMRCDLYPDGMLVVYKDSEWDFGTFAIDTPAMVVASLEHDAFCNMTNSRDLPWSCRLQADKNFWNRLTENGATISRLWRVPGVMLYSQLVARWKDKQ